MNPISVHELKPPFCFLFKGVRDQLYRTPAQLKSHTDDSGSFFGALGFTVPVEELTLRMASRASVLDWLTQPKGPRLANNPGNFGDS